MTMTVTGDNDNTGGEGCDDDNNNCGLTSATNKQQSI
jgi:hypothetical protein